MILKQELSNIIQLSHNELALLKEDDLNLELLNKLEADRFEQIKTLFESVDSNELANEVDLLNEIKILDQQLASLVAERKNLIKNELLGFRNKNKVSKAYKAYKNV